MRRLAFSLTNKSFNQLEDDKDSIEHAVMTCCANHVSTSFLRQSRRRLWGIRQTGGSALGLRVASWRTECGDLCSSSASCSTVKSSSIVSYLITLVLISLPPGLFSVKQAKACRLGPKNLDSHRTIRASLARVCAQWDTREKWTNTTWPGYESPAVPNLAKAGVDGGL